MGNLTNLFRRRIALYLLIVVAARAFVAPGWMLTPSDISGFPSLTLVVCPTQSPELHQWLNVEDFVGGHEHHQSSQPSLSVVDLGCGLWAASDVELHLVSLSSDTRSDSANISSPNAPIVLTNRIHSRYRVRAPPHRLS